MTTVLSENYAIRVNNDAASLKRTARDALHRPETIRVNNDAASLKLLQTVIDSVRVFRHPRQQRRGIIEAIFFGYALLHKIRPSASTTTRHH